MILDYRKYEYQIIQSKFTRVQRAWTASRGSYVRCVWSWRWQKGRASPFWRSTIAKTMLLPWHSYPTLKIRKNNNPRELRTVFSMKHTLKRNKITTELSKPYLAIHQQHSIVKNKFTSNNTNTPAAFGNLSAITSMYNAIHLLWIQIRHKLEPSITDVSLLNRCFKMPRL